jgi:uncharacterized protein
VLPRQPGTKESRYMHLFSGEAPASTEQVPQIANKVLSGDDRARLENEVAELRREFAEMKEKLAEFRRQFE